MIKMGFSITIWADKGYAGLKSALDANNNNIIIPHKKPKNKELTQDQKEENRIIASIRMLSEHAINGIKRFSALSDVYRNRRGQDDTMTYLAAVFWNFHLQYHNC